MANNLKPKYTNKSFNVTTSAGTGTVFALLGVAGTTPGSPAGDTACVVYQGTGAPAGSPAVAPAGGLRLTQLRAINVSTVAVVSLFMGTTAALCRLIGVVSVAANSGFDGTVPVTNLLNSTLFPDLQKDNAGNYYMDIPEGQTLFITCSVADRVKIFGTGYNYTA